MIKDLVDGVAAMIKTGLTTRQHEQLAWMAQTDVTDVYDTRTLDSLARRGFVESYDDDRIGTCWRITDAGCRALASEPENAGDGTARRDRDGEGGDDGT